MSEFSAATTLAYAVRVEFFSGAEPFAAETFRIDVAEGQDLLVLACACVERSAYWNERIPDLERTIDVQPLDPDEPDPPPPASGGGAALGAGGGGGKPPPRRGGAAQG